MTDGRISRLKPVALIAGRLQLGRGDRGNGSLIHLTGGLWPALSAHYDVGERVQLLLEMEHPLFVIGQGLGVFLDALASTFLEVRLHHHRILKIAELLPDAFQRRIDARITAKRNVPVCFRMPKVSLTFRRSGLHVR